MIANCGQLGLDYRAVSIGEYFEALEAHNDAAGADSGKGGGDPDKLAAVMAARMAG
ncbi:hypothetical protein [Sphingobium yanoikuyae]|uniref:hypothetical protein n=1 Tax=Sphingobium yanoikuyae TaxID=13690 RepID=UPI000AFE1AC5|nr:hypothetical protein [Sphingobium yanoikuyae]